MKSMRFLLAGFGATMMGCSAFVHGPMQNVQIASDPPGAEATITPQTSERGPRFVDKDSEMTVRTPATVQLRRDTNYRVEWQMPGYRIESQKLRSAYDWTWAPVACGPCEAVGALPRPDMKDRALALRFLSATFYEYPVGAIGAAGLALRLLSPEALLGTSFKLKSQNDGYFDDFFAVGTPTVSTTLEPLD